MSLSEEIILVVVDKLLIGGILGAAALYVSSRLERRKAADELKKAFAADRAKAYQGLWAASITPVDEPSRSAVAESLRKWYAEGGALFLSLTASREFFRAKKALHDPDTRLDLAKAALSRLRTELKHDCGSYSRQEAETQIIEAA